MNRQVAGVFLILASMAAQASGPQVLMELRSAPGQSLHGFALTLSPHLRGYSDKTGFEACAELAQEEGPEGKVFGAVITTSLGKATCEIDPRRVPTGMRSIGQSIHSHGRDEEGMLSIQDFRLRGEPMDARSAARSRITGQRTDEFSASDLSGEPGYLAIKDGAVLYHDGKGKVQRISRR